MKQYGIRDCENVSTPGLVTDVKDEDLTVLDASDHRRYRTIVGKLMRIVNECPDIDFVAKIAARMCSCSTIGDLCHLKRNVSIPSWDDGRRTMLALSGGGTSVEMHQGAF